MAASRASARTRWTACRPARPTDLENRRKRRPSWYTIAMHRAGDIRTAVLKLGRIAHGDVNHARVANIRSGAGPIVGTDGQEVPAVGPVLRIDRQPEFVVGRVLVARTVVQQTCLVLLGPGGLQVGVAVARHEKLGRQLPLTGGPDEPDSKAAKQVALRDLHVNHIHRRRRPRDLEILDVNPTPPFGGRALYRERSGQKEK